MSQLALEQFINARAVLARRNAGRQAVRLGREVHGPDADATDMILDFPDPASPPLAIHMLYSDTHGNLSGRCVTLRALQEQVADVRVSGYCHMRQAIRTFLASRAVEVTDLATGEVHDDGLAFFRNHPLLRHLTADTLAAMSPALAAVQECRDEIILLSFLAASDGDFADCELDAIVTHVLDAVPDEDVTEHEVRMNVKAFVPDEGAFVRSLRRICEGSGEPRRLLRSMRRVVDADGEVDPEEVTFVTEIEAELRAAGRI